MKIRNSFILIIVFIILISTAIYSNVLNITMEKSILQIEEEKISQLSKIISYQLDEYILGSIRTVETLANSELIKENLITSNQFYSEIPETEGNEKIVALNDKWLQIDSETNPFVVQHLDNEVSNYLRKHKISQPEWYGEIFLTNKFGLAIGLTNKLTTIKHNHKYWWKGAYNQGNGKIFLDDRGYDESVEGYVLGIVVPVYDKGEIIGILKANINIIDVLNQSLTDYESLYKTLKVSVARSSGLIVASKGVESLQENVSEEISLLLQHKTATNFENETTLGRINPISITFDNKNIEFGGSNESIDHSSGNQGESWHLLVFVEKKEIFDGLNDIIRKNIMFISFILVTLVSISIILITHITRPIEQIIKDVNIIGTGNLGHQADIKSNNEIGILAKTINNMSTHLKVLMISKEKLEVEVKKRLETEKQLIKSNNTDDLTGIYNRKYFNQKIEEAINQTNRYKDENSIVMLDIDYFKKINDIYGHSEGDKVLIKIARKIETLVRKVDTFARWGGDEFIILLSRIDSKEANIIVERIRESVMELDYGKEERITISVGVTTFKENDSVDSLFTRADKALYKAKETGRNKIVKIEV
ncbi:diguanylate cyclase [Clostridiaceae bacterium HSG29]|nr:diguanylate cyclase [Clostridiaceae bacterium HSG29]